MQTYLFEDGHSARRLCAIVEDGEKRVLRPLMGGQSNKEIAAYLGIRECSVKTHVASMMAAGRFANRVQLARWAILNAKVFDDRFIVPVDLHGMGCQCPQPRCVVMREFDVSVSEDQLDYQLELAA